MLTSYMLGLVPIVNKINSSCIGGLSYLKVRCQTFLDYVAQIH